MENKLTGIPETMLIPLWARAAEAEQADPIVRDDKAVEMVSHIDYDFTKFKKAKLTQLGVSIRTMLLDRATRDFLQHNLNAVVINLGAVWLDWSAPACATATIVQDRTLEFRSPYFSSVAASASRT